jgi:hypothetical protein
MLVAVIMLFVVGAMAALSIDVVTLYTARSEAQLAADAAALAGARALANSGMTSDPNAVSDNLATNAEALAQAVATQVAASNTVGGRNLIPGGPCAGGGEISVCFNSNDPAFVTNPHVTVRVQRTDLPTFFARIWGRKQIAVAASATAEAYNPSGASALAVGVKTIPVAPMCVKPWLLPNISPAAGGPIFNPSTGAIGDPTLRYWPNNPFPAIRLRTACTTNCGTAPPSPQAWYYYPGNPADFPPPNAASVPGSAGLTSRPNYQLAIAGCVQTPISCNSLVHVDTIPDSTRDLDTAAAVNVLSHATANGGDQFDYAATPIPPFKFAAGFDNPIVQSNPSLNGTDIMVSDSLVTVPVINVDNTTTPWPPTGYSPVQIIGFVQLFLNTNGRRSGSGRLRTQVINLTGCGTNATGQPIIGNGASPVPVRLISPP